ncbi:MAG: ribonuclease P protein component [Dehalococcoidales bacterium]|nr:ribonuclease P protein component [Dehalococcoidales bacterium]
MSKVGRLKKPREYALVYSKGRSWTSRLLVIRVIPNDLNETRFGLSVSKKVGNAVARNKVKRRLREITRTEPVKPGWDIVIIVRPAVSGTAFSELRESVRDLLSQAGILEVKEESPV